MQLQDFYKRKDAAFKDIDVFVVSKDGKRVADICFKTSPSGATVTCYLTIHNDDALNSHAIGAAKGYNYDKQGDAVGKAAKRICDAEENRCNRAIAWHLRDMSETQSWGGCLRTAGYEVWQIV